MKEEQKNELINQAIERFFNLIKYCEKCKCLIKEVDAFKGKSEIRERNKTGFQIGNCRTTEEYIYTP